MDDRFLEDEMVFDALRLPTVAVLPFLSALLRVSTYTT